jgi:hypothetical protein
LRSHFGEPVARGGDWLSGARFGEAGGRCDRAEGRMMADFAWLLVFIAIAVVVAAVALGSLDW